VQAAVGYGVGGYKLPVFLVRLHNFKTRGYPVDAVKQVVQAGVGGRCAAHTKHCFGFYARLACACQRYGALLFAKAERGVVHRAPDGRKHVVARPDAAVGKAYFVAARYLAPRHA
jgi:hypothetical protein